MEISIKKLDAFKAIGVRWQGTFQDARDGEIKRVMQQFYDQLGELPNKMDKTAILGISYHITENGFTYYICCKSDESSVIPNQMEEISVPTLEYVTCEHDPSGDIADTYSAVYKWIGENDYQENEEIDLKHLEVYPADYEPMNEPPRLTIHIPVTRV
jgi:predicted transcriptional regulator YdeE